MKRSKSNAKERKNNFISWQTRLIPLLLFIIPVFLCTETKNSTPQTPLKFVTVAQDSSFAYLFHIYPHKESKLLYMWQIAIKELNTGKLVTSHNAQTMRGQENEIHLKDTYNSSRIKITFTIHSKQPKFLYNIERTIGDKVVYRCEGETKLADDKTTK